MQWLNSLDAVVDRVLVNANQEDDDEFSVDTDAAASTHSDPGPFHDSEQVQDRPLSNLSASLLQRIENIHNNATIAVEEEESDHFVSGAPSEQTAGQDSTSSVGVFLAPVIEPDTSMLAEENDDDDDDSVTKLPTFEPSSSCEPLHMPSMRDMNESDNDSLGIQRESQTEPSLDMGEISDDNRNDMIETRRIQQLDDDEAMSDSQQVFRDSTTTRPLYTANAIRNNLSSDNSERASLNVSFENEHGNDNVSDVPAQVMHHQQQQDDNEFNVALPLAPWDPLSNKPLDPWLNCYGVVHVRLICAQRLPCPVGSNVQAIVALPPWKGRVRTEKTKAFSGPLEESGVCVRWDQLHDAGYCSMVNSWNSLENPTPTIAIDLVFYPMQMLEFSMCTVNLSCAPLMREPGEWKKQWCQTSLTQKVNDPDKFLEADERVPLVLLEAMFMPSGMEEEADEEAEDEVANVEEEEPGEELSVRTPSSLGASTPPTLRSRKRGGGASVGTGTSYLLSQRTKSHLLRVQSLWVPAACAVCNSVITGWKSAYRCEVCNIDCCKDCQLQVDLQIPCGSSIAEAAVASSFHNKLTVHNIMSVVAPWDDSAKKVSSSAESEHLTQIGVSGARDVGDGASSNVSEQGIGTLLIHVASACMFEKSLHPESNPEDVFKELDDQAVRKGDYYVRLTPNDNVGSRRTRTIQNTGRPQFDSEELSFNVLNYGMEYRVEVVDAYADKPVGMAVVPAQGLLQQQRDAIVAADGFSVINPFQKPLRCTEKRRWRLELRTGAKNGDYFASSKGRTTGEITGWLDVDLCLVESTDRLYGSKPIECPPRPPDGLNVELFQAHIARIGTIISDIKKGIAACAYVVSWKNPALTSLSLIIFVTLCLRFNAEYVASLPVFFLVVYMAYLATARKAGRLKERFIERETAASLQSEEKVAVKYSIYRPIGRLQISVLRGRNIRSRDLGLTGSAGSRIYWDPLRYCDNDKVKAALISVDSSMSGSHDVAVTNYQYAANPEWNEVYESEETKRLQQLIPSQGEFFATPESSLASNKKNPSTCIFPVLRPIRVGKQRQGSLHGKGSGDNTGVELDEWESTTSAVVVEVRFQDVLNKLPGFDDVLGEVSLPLSQIIKDGGTRGWFHVSDPDAPGVNPNAPIKSLSTSVESAPNEYSEPEVYLEVKWIPPESNDENIDSEREASVVIAEEMIRSASQAQNKGIDLMGSSIGAFNTVTGLSGHVHMIQNALGSALDIAESIRNAFNFTDPQKSSVLFCALVLLWLFLAMVPLRMLILLGGLGMYASTFIAMYFPSSPSSENEKKMPEKAATDETDRADKQESAVATWIVNAIRGLPTDEDLRKAYFWESKRVGEEARAALAERKRTARLQKLWRAQWYANVQLKTARHIPSPRESSRDWHWEDAFAIVQGRRLLWWPSAHDFDNGEAPAGCIFLAGHAGLAGLSPLEMRQMKESEIPLVVSIFGRGLKEQQKLTILTESVESKEELENAILEASTKQD